MLRYFGNPTNIMLPGVYLLSRGVSEEGSTVQGSAAVVAVHGSHLAQVQG